MSPHTVVRTHALCAGPGCNSCARIEADANRIRAELRDRLDRATPDQYEAALRELAHTDPDAVNAALDEAGAPA